MSTHPNELPGITQEPLTAQEIAAVTGRDVEEVTRTLAAVRLGMQPVERKYIVTEGGYTRTRTVTRTGVGMLETPFGAFWQMDFVIDDQWVNYHVLWCGEVDMFDNFALRPGSPDHVIMRTDSGCKTGQVFHDATCDCREQLHAAMAHIASVGEGLVIHIPGQDGRGMRLNFKLGTLTLQQLLGVDTIQSARMLTTTGTIDARTYDGIIAILKFLGFETGTQVNLVTNNPRKKAVFADNGYPLESTPCLVEAPAAAQRHMVAKEAALGHVGLGSNGNGRAEGEE